MELLELLKDPIINETAIKKILIRNPDVNVQNGLGQTALMVGAMRMAPDGSSELIDEEIIEELLSKTDFSLVDKIGNTLLHYFCLYGVQKKIKLVIEKCDIFAQNSKGEAPLHHVHDTLVMSHLLEAYPYLESRPTYNRSELYTNTEDYLLDRNSNFKKPVIELFCDSTTGYQVPSDMHDIILLALKKATEGSQEKLNVLSTLLKFGHSCINAEHFKVSVKKGSKPIFDILMANCRSSNLKSLVSSSDVLLECIKNKNSGNLFFEVLIRHINSRDTLTLIRDGRGANMGHYVCEYENSQILEQLIKDMWVLAQLFGEFDSKGSFPIAYLKNKTGSDFVNILNHLHWSCGIPLLAKPSVDSIHYAIETKKFKLANTLISAGFPLLRNSLGQTLLHKIVISSYTKTSLLEMVYNQVGTEVVLDQDNFGFSALDYSILYEKEEQFDFLIEKHNDYDKENAVKIIHYLAYHSGRSEENVAHFLEKLSIDFPQTENPDFTRETLLQIKRSESSIATTSLTSSSATKQAKRMIYNLIIFHNDASDLNPGQSNLIDISLNSDERIVFCHFIPINSFSFDHAHFFCNLLNRRLVFLGDYGIKPSIEGVLINLFNTSRDHVVFSFKGDCAAKCSVLVHRSGNEDESSFQEPKVFNLDCIVCEVDVQLGLEVDLHNKLSGNVFSENGVVSTKLYGHDLDATHSDDVRAMLCRLGLMDRYFTDDGALGFHKRVGPGAPTAQSTSSLKIELKIIKGGINVSRFSVQVISSELISRFLVLPGEGGGLLLLKQPDVNLRFEIDSDENDDDFVKVSLDVEDEIVNMGSAILEYVTRMLKKVGFVFQKSSGAQILHRVNRKFCDITLKSEDDTAQGTKENGIGEHDIELAEVDTLPPPSPAPLKGSSPLLSCDLSALATGLLRAEPNKPLNRYFTTLDPACPMLEEGRTSALLHRLILARGAKYTVRQFVKEGKWDVKQQQTICDAIGIDIGETYSKINNCWRLNWADMLVLGIGITICVTILVVCEVLEVDLETYGVAGIASLPFILAFLNRIRMSYSHRPQYSKLPDLNPE